MAIHEWRPGLLPRQYLEELQKQKAVSGGSIGEASIDLHLSRIGYHTKGSLKLKENETCSELLNQESFCEEHLDLQSETLLKAHSTYLIQLRENLSLRDMNIHGQATGKSSIGRLDVLTRLMADKNPKYDMIGDNYCGSLWIEVTPITFPIMVKEGVCLNQLRLFRGKPELCVIAENQLPLFGKMTTAVNPKILTLDLSPVNIEQQEVIAFMARVKQYGDAEALDLTKKDAKIKPQLYWELVPPQGDFIRIEKDRFYILRSKERFMLPPDVGVHCQAITENLGEIRIHYAGFVHPGFGLYRNGVGTPLIFEVRGHTVDAFLRDGEIMANIDFYRLSEGVEFTEEEERKMAAEVYQNQELQLSQYFGEWKS